jgi:PHD-finger
MKRQASPQCPVCGGSFALHLIEQHANQCLERKASRDARAFAKVAYASPAPGTLKREADAAMQSPQAKHPRSISKTSSKHEPSSSSSNKASKQQRQQQQQQQDDEGIEVTDIDGFLIFAASDVEAISPNNTSAKRKRASRSPKADSNLERCSVCRTEGGEQLACDQCPRVYHFACASVVTADDLPEHWQCSSCASGIDSQPPALPAHASLSER